MRYRFLVLLTCVAALGTTRTVAQPLTGTAEERFFRQQRLLDESQAAQRTHATPLTSVLDWQFGGWIDYYLFSLDDGIQKSRNIQQPGLTLWTRLSLDDGAHEAFLRYRLRYTYYQPGDEIERDRQEDWRGPEPEQAWYQIDVNKALRWDTGPLRLKARVGRQTVVFGTGYALDLGMDAARLDARLGNVAVTGLFGRPIPNNPNIDRSEPVDSHSDRLMYGVQLAYEGLDRHVPFVYGLWNNDRTKEWSRDPWQDYSYDSFYFGFGSRGEIIPDLNYGAEMVFESGHSFSNGAFLRRDYVDAYGWDLLIEKLYRVPTRPRVSAEYMFASGDKDRIFSPTNAAGGNRQFTKDSSFNGFGFRDTGIALAPTLNNLHIWKVGGSFAPLERYDFFRNMELGTSWFLFWKNRSQGAISDPLADNFDGYVGWEMDYFVNWRLSSDLSFTVRWGAFFPGGSYSDDRPRHSIFGGLTWSF